MQFKRSKGTPNQPNHSLYHTVITRITSEEAFKSHAGHVHCEDEEMVEGGRLMKHFSESLITKLNTQLIVLSFETFLE